MPRSVSLCLTLSHDRFMPSDQRCCAHHLDAYPLVSKGRAPRGIAYTSTILPYFATKSTPITDSLFHHRCNQATFLACG